jgi:aminocarboxymuconate-semialdehyde decarboxylase
MAPRTVDFHNHVIPPPAVASLRRAGNPFEADERDGTIQHHDGIAFPMAPEMHDVEEKLRSLDARGLELAVVSPSPTLLGCNHPADEALEACRILNDGLLEMVAEAPDRLRPMAAVPLQDAEQAVAEMERMAAAGCRSVMVGTFATGWRLGQPSLRPFWRRAQELDLLVFLHPFFVGAKPGMEHHYLTNLAGNPLETALAMADIVLSGVLDELPELKILLAHGGGYAPYQYGRIRHGHEVREEVRTDEPHDPFDHLRSFYFDTITHSAQALDFLVRFAGADRVLVGTDLPFDMADFDPVGTVDSVALTRRDRDLVLAGNALRLLGEESGSHETRSKELTV